MSDNTTQKLSLWAKLAALVARLGGAIASTALKGKDSQKALEISSKVGDVNDAIGSALDQENQP